MTGVLANPKLGERAMQELPFPALGAHARAGSQLKAELATPLVPAQSARGSRRLSRRKPVGAISNMALDLEANRDLQDAVGRARAAADKDGSLHPLPGKHVQVTPKFRAAIARLVGDGTYASAVAEVVADDPELA